jgi:deoxyribodipyrimidine photo-lyase
MMDKIIIWFRRDLRIHDNPVLSWALSSGKAVMAVYIDDPESDNPWKPGTCSRWWLHYSLEALQKSLSSLGVYLNIFQGDTAAVFKQLIAEHQIHSITWHERYEPYERALENSVLSLLQEQKISSRIFNDRLIASPEQFLNLQKKPYKVFTPFYKRVLKIVNAEYDVSNVKRVKNISAIRHDDSLDINALDLLSDHDWHKKLHSYWQPGEVSAQKQLDDFIDHYLVNYLDNRDFPAKDETSRLSPHLHFGEISIRSVYKRLFEMSVFEKDCLVPIEVFIRQLIWREFAAYLLWHFPDSIQQPMNSSFSRNFWRHENELYDAWCQGKTGIILVDAGMQQLWQSGWMHNRVRMVCASLLTKNIGVSWLSGARWFWDTLVDADLANNTMGWQWVAGCGVDAAPYYRIFNPDRQAKQYDPAGKYADRWISERSLEQPLINLQTSRQQALERYQIQRGEKK